jgi:hypothetical protein
MTKLSFAIDSNTFSVSRGFRGSDDVATVTVDVTTLPEAILARLFEYGLTQKIADKASGAQDLAEAQAMLSEAVKQLSEGDWRVRASGTPSDPMTAWRRKAVRTLAKANEALAAKIKEFEAGTDRNAYLDHIASANESVVEPLATKLLKAHEAAKSQGDVAELTL